MRIVCISCFDYYETRMSGLINYFLSKGHKVQYLISDFNHFSKDRNVMDHKFGKKVHVPSYKKNLSISRLFSHFCFSKKVYSILNRTKPELIYCIIPPNSLVKYIAKYKKTNSNCLVIFDVYDMWPESFPHKPHNFAILRCFEIWRRIRDDYINCSDLLLTVSEKAKSQLKSKYKSRIKVLFPSLDALDIPNYCFDISSSIAFLYLGNINHITNIELGTKLLGELAKYKKVTLHIIGEGQNLKKWIALLEKHNVNVICHGVVFDIEKKREVFQKCHFGLNIPKQEIESSMSLKSIEYMRFGLPVINSGCGDNRRIVEEYSTGVNIDEKCVDAIVSKITHFENNELINLHKNSCEYYSRNFINQDYDSILDSINLKKQGEK